MSMLVTIYWRDIPAQVIAKDGDSSHRVELPERFQNAIDSAAMKAGAISNDDYLAEWRRENRDAPGDPQAEAEAAARALDQAFPAAVLRELVAKGGWSGDGDEQ